MYFMVFLGLGLLPEAYPFSLNPGNGGDLLRVCSAPDVAALGCSTSDIGRSDGASMSRIRARG